MTDLLAFLSHPLPGRFFLIAGPCVVEDGSMPGEIAADIAALARAMNIPFVFKASYKKANRTRLDSFAGIGDEKALRCIAEAGQHLGIPTLTDVHSEREAELAAAYVDILQIPAFLCRQTSLLQAAAATGKAVNIKKGQFVSAQSMGFAVEKVRAAGSGQHVLLTERGSMFGYNDLVVDYRSIPGMKEHGVPVVLDITHSLQQPNQSSGVSGGNPGMITTIALAGIAAGADGIFLETHPEPASAKSDGANMLKLSLLEGLLSKMVRLKETVDSLQ